MSLHWPFPQQKRFSYRMLTARHARPESFDAVILISKTWNLHDFYELAFWLYSLDSSTLHSHRLIVAEFHRPSLWQDVLSVMHMCQLGAAELPSEMKPRFPLGPERLINRKTLEYLNMSNQLQHWDTLGFVRMKSLFTTRVWREVTAMSALGNEPSIHLVETRDSGRTWENNCRGNQLSKKNKSQVGRMTLFRHWF